MSRQWCVMIVMVMVEKKVMISIFRNAVVKILWVWVKIMIALWLALCRKQKMESVYGEERRGDMREQENMGTIWTLFCIIIVGVCECKSECVYTPKPHETNHEWRSWMCVCLCVGLLVMCVWHACICVCACVVQLVVCVCLCVCVCTFLPCGGSEGQILVTSNQDKLSLPAEENKSSHMYTHTHTLYSHTRKRQTFLACTHAHSRTRWHVQTHTHTISFTFPHTCKQHTDTHTHTHT